MFESKQLRVKPIRRYRAPRYPSHVDPDPTLHPTPVPFPASGKLLAAVAAMGVAASTSCSEPSGGASSPVTVHVASPIDEIKPPKENPFPVATAGLPHRTSPYGTGQPDYLDEKLARQAIEQVFAEAGYHLAPDVRYDRSGVACKTSGYDAEKKIGYIWADYMTLENDAVLRWWRPAAANTSGNSQPEIEAYLRELTDIPEQKAVVAEIEAAMKLPDPARREAAYRAILDQRNRDRLSMAEFKELERPAPGNHDFIAVISTYDSRFHQVWSGEPPSEEMEKLGAQLQTANEQNDEQKVAELWREIELVSSRKTLFRLQQTVREYIAWARSQGAQ